MMLMKYTTYHYLPYICNVKREQGYSLPKLRIRNPHQKERLKSEWNLITGLPKDKQKTKRLLFTETKSTIPERESLKSERDSNTE